MTLKRYIIIKPDGKVFTQYGSHMEAIFKDRKRAEQIAVSWGQVKEVLITIGK